MNEIMNAISWAMSYFTYNKIQNKEQRSEIR